MHNFQTENWKGEGEERENSSKTISIGYQNKQNESMLRQGRGFVTQPQAKLVHSSWENTDMTEEGGGKSSRKIL